VSKFQYYDVIQNEEYPPVGFIHKECRSGADDRYQYILSDEEIGFEPYCLSCFDRIVNTNFNAILAKNAIARIASRESFQNGEYVICRLEEIEQEIGVANQPGVREIFEHNSNPERNFEI
jgi:hypothetical protein